MNNSSIDKTVFLFYKEYERDSFFRHDRYLKRVLRPIANRFRRSQTVSGFYIWYVNLVKALHKQGYRVELNNYRLARKNPTYPVGLVGYPIILEGWDLPNPALLGPGFFDHPQICPDLMQDPRFRLYVVTCQWMKDIFEPVYGPCVVDWYAGIDTDLWNDTKDEPKSVDFLIYDKIRWEREKYEPSLLNPIINELEQRNLSYHILRYGQYQHAEYRRALGFSKAMLFLCEHETQGLAYQEALASNVPILAWDNGFWLDPRRPGFDPNPVPATSVPYFSPECGERFRDFSGFIDALDTFVAKLPTYEPRCYVQQNLSLEGSARLYMKHYSSLM